MLEHSGIVYSPGTVQFRYLCIHTTKTRMLEATWHAWDSARIVDALYILSCQVGAGKESRPYIDKLMGDIHTIKSLVSLSIQDSGGKPKRVPSAVSDKNNLQYLKALNSGRTFKGLDDLLNAMVELNSEIVSSSSMDSNNKNNEL